MLKGRLYLIGMPGSGKSYFARKLADHFSFPMVDLDEVVEEREGKTISDIFEMYGEDYFRKSEFETLKSISEKHKDMIISTGGGAPCFFDGIDYMNNHGITVFLRVEKEILIERLSQQTNRPLMTGDLEDKIDLLLTNRLKIYQKAQLTLDHQDPNLFLAQIEQLKK